MLQRGYTSINGLLQMFYAFASLVYIFCYKVTGEVFGVVGLASTAKSFCYKVPGEVSGESSVRFPASLWRSSYKLVLFFSLKRTVLCFNEVKVGLFLAGTKQNQKFR
jgi:hypothetical protein